MIYLVRIFLKKQLCITFLELNSELWLTRNMLLRCWTNSKYSENVPLDYIRRHNWDWSQTSTLCCPSNYKLEAFQIVGNSQLKLNNLINCIIFRVCWSKDGKFLFGDQAIKTMKLSYPTVSSWTISHQERGDWASDKLQNISLNPQHKIDEAQLKNTGKKHKHFNLW